MFGLILEHARNLEKNYWTEVVVITTTNNSFGLTKISYLKNQFTKLATDADRYIVKNRNATNLGDITEEKESKQDEFIESDKIIMVFN